MSLTSPIILSPIPAGACLRTEVPVAGIKALQHR